jgi:hypothetical protein
MVSFSFPAESPNQQALPVYEENTLVGYNIFHARLLINHAENGRKYLYDILAVKKETSKP